MIPDFRKANLFSLEWGMVNDKGQKGTKGFGNGDPCPEEWVMKEENFCTLGYPFTGKIKGSFETTGEHNETGEGKMKKIYHRECTKWHFLTKKQFTGLCPPTASGIQDAEDQTLGVGLSGRALGLNNMKIPWGLVQLQ